MTEHQNEIVVFDLDGTLSNLEHRLHYIRGPKGTKRDWPAFLDNAIVDDPEHAIITLAQLLYERYIIWIFSGRSDIVRDDTKYWLKMHGVPYNYLKMREDGDYTPDHELKESWLAEHRLVPAKDYHDHGRAGLPVEMVFDDRRRVVDMWRSHGFKVLQVEPGEF